MKDRRANIAPGTMTLQAALRSLVEHSADLLIRRWNWKAAFFSSLIRAMLFFFANLTAGWHAAVGAMSAEYCYRAVTSGFYGAISQRFGEVEPEWQGTLAAIALLPLGSHVAEFAVHWLRHTPNLRASIVSSICFTIMSTLFNVYAMKRGAMCVGAGSASMGQDMKALPGILCDFVCCVPLWLWRHVRGRAA